MLEPKPVPGVLKTNATKHVGVGGGGNPNRPGNLVYSPAPEGLYRVVLEVDGQEYSTNANILEDYWWDKQF